MGEIDTLLAAIDAVNGEDPNEIDGVPLALAQGRRAEAWVLRLEPRPSDALRLAARAHHIRRWELPRSSYPDGRAGYLRWRREQKTRHGAALSTVLNAAQADDTVRERATEIVQKLGLARDPEVQTFEDAVALTFIETQFVTTTDKIADDDKMVDVVTKTLRKLSPAGLAAAGSISLDERSAALVARAVEQLSS